MTVTQELLATNRIDIARAGPRRVGSAPSQCQLVRRSRVMAHGNYRPIATMIEHWRDHILAYLPELSRFRGLTRVRSVERDRGVAREVPRDSEYCVTMSLP